MDTKLLFGKYTHIGKESGFMDYLHLDNLQRIAVALTMIIVTWFGAWLLMPHTSIYGQQISRPTAQLNVNELNTANAVGASRLDAIERHQIEQDRRSDERAVLMAQVVSDISAIKATGATVSAVVVILGLLGLLRKNKP